MDDSIVRKGISGLAVLLEKGTFLALTLYVIIFAIYLVMGGTYVISIEGMTELSNSSVAIAVAAAAETFIILIGGFDLSVVGIVVLCNTLIAVSGGSLGYGGQFITSTFTGVTGALICLLIALGVGAIVGLINGFLVAGLGLQAIVATLGTSIVCSGVALLFMEQPGGNVPDSITNGLSGDIGPIPVTFLIMVAVALVCWLILRKSNFGISIYAIGRDRAAAQLSGIALRSVEFRTFILAGIFSGLSGFMLSVQTGTGSPQLSDTFLLLTFAAVAIGGASFEGGRGSAIGSMIGAALLAVLQKMLFAVGVSNFYTGIFQGLIMILAMILSTMSGRSEKRRLSRVSIAQTGVGDDTRVQEEAIRQ